MPGVRILFSEVVYLKPHYLKDHADMRAIHSGNFEVIQ